MKLKCKDNINYFEGQIVASLEENTKNICLMNLLSKISGDGFKNLKNDEAISSFLPGLRTNLIKSGLLNKDGTLNNKGKEIVKTGYTFNKLQGAFSVSFVENNNYLYITKCELAKENGNNEKKNWEDSQLPGKFGDKEYIYADNKIRNVETLNDQFLQKKSPNVVNTESVYDFETKKCETVINIGNNNIKINTTDKNKFKIIDSNIAVDNIKSLELPFYFDDENHFWVDKPLEYILKDHNCENLLIKVYKNGQFDYKNNKTEISECRLNIKEERVIEVLNHYLMKNVENSYLGYNEIGRLIMDFPGLFENHPVITDSTENIYNELKNNAEIQNQKAFKRLQAYQDLCPDIVFNDYISKSPLDFTKKEKSWNDIIDQIFGKDRDIKSVMTISKYAYRNKFISKGFEIISDCLLEKGVKLNVIFCEDKRYENNHFDNNIYFKRFTEKCNAIKRDWSELRVIHDRYWKVTRKNSVEWFKISGEVDSLRFDFNENPNPDKNTTGIVKEMTVTFIEESGVPENVKKLFAECEK